MTHILSTDLLSRMLVALRMAEAGRVPGAAASVDLAVRALLRQSRGTFAAERGAADPRDTGPVPIAAVDTADMLDVLGRLVATAQDTLDAARAALGLDPVSRGGFGDWT